MDNVLGKCSEANGVAKEELSQSTSISRRAMPPIWMQRTLGGVAAIVLAMGFLPANSESTGVVAGVEINSPDQSPFQRADLIDDIVDILEDILGGGEGGG